MKTKRKWNHLKDIWDSIKGMQHRQRQFCKKKQHSFIGSIWPMYKQHQASRPLFIIYKCLHLTVVMTQRHLTSIQPSAHQSRQVKNGESPAKQENPAIGYINKHTASSIQTDRYQKACQQHLNMKVAVVLSLLQVVLVCATNPGVQIRLSQPALDYGK